MVKKAPLDTKQVIKRAGGAPHVGSQINVPQATVYNWYHDGIPEQHWEPIAILGDLTVTDIYIANKIVRERKSADQATAA